MNSYVRAHSRKLPLLEKCHGPDTQEDGIIRHVLNQLNVKSSFLVEFGQRTLGAGTLGRIAQELRYSLLNIDAAAIKDLISTNPPQPEVRAPAASRNARWQ